MINVPPIRLLASPIADTFTSIVPPARAKAGNSAVTKTAATFLGRYCSPLTLTPRRSRMFDIISSVNGAFRMPSPVPFKPTTRPYPIRSLPRTPSNSTRSLILTSLANAAPEQPKKATKIAKSIFISRTPQATAAIALPLQCKGFRA